MSERMSAREVLAQAIWTADGSTDSSWGFVNEKRRGEYRHQADCALKALKANGYAVVEIPEPEEREEGAIATSWEDVAGLQVDVWDAYPDEVGLAYNYDPFEPLSPNESRKLAAALLAAATAAERDSEER